MGPRVLTLSLLNEGGLVADDVVAMVVEASFDPEIPAMNDLPRGLDAARARQLCTGREGVILRLDGEPVGAAIAQRDPWPGDGVELPAGCVELDEWVLAPFRGLGLLGKRGAWPLIAAWLAGLADYALAVTWTHNYAAQSLVRSRGYRHLGATYWTGPVSAGSCEVFVYDLTPHRSAS